MGHDVGVAVIVVPYDRIRVGRGLLGGDVWQAPAVVSCFDKIDRLKDDRRLDRFFSLAGRRIGHSGVESAGQLQIFRNGEAAQSREGGRSYRIANLVLQGGGVLGLAHAGFIAGLERADVRFAGLAGASAGAIMAMGLTAVRGADILRPSSEKLYEIISDMPMASFIDGPASSRELIKRFLLKQLKFGPTSWPTWFSALRRLLKKRGLNPGDAFEEWLSNVLGRLGLSSMDELERILSLIGSELTQAMDDNDRDFPKQPDSEQYMEINSSELLQIMSVCIPLGVKFSFPTDIAYLATEVRNISPAAIVRASMSIPLFFDPVEFPVTREENWKKYVLKKIGNFVSEEKCEEYSKIGSVQFLDGGIFSNLPADAFDDILPDFPTIAVPLTTSRLAKPYRRRARLSSLIEDIGAVGFMVRNHRDRDAIDQLDRRRNLRRRYGAVRSQLPLMLQPIDVGDTNWLNFAMESGDMTKLFITGMEHSINFLEQLTEGAS